MQGVGTDEPAGHGQFRDSPFAPPPQGWVAVSPRLANARRLLAGMVAVIAAVAGLVVVAVTAGPSVGAATSALGVGWLLVCLIGFGWAWWVIGRQVRAMGYSERTDDLLVVRGVMFRRLVIVPYGRMQLVDVTQGLVDRAFGLSTVQLHTAAATSDAAIDGLPPDVAAGLRDRLAARGESRSAGL